jgi:hypothetical protein
MSRHPEIFGCALFALLFSVLLTSQSAPRVNSLRFSTPVPVVTLEMEELKGEPSRLAWSPEGTQLYLQTLEGGFGRPDVALHHYILDAASGATQSIDSEPEWAYQYWTAKSGQSSPDDPPLTIELKTERQRQQTTSLPTGGDLARGGLSPGLSENDELTIIGAQMISVITLLLNGEIVGEFTNSVLVPGLTYGWGPMGAKVIAFATPKTGRVAVMDDLGQKQEIAGSKNAILPAWSPNGDRVIWLQKEGRRKFSLQVARVSIS